MSGQVDVHGILEFAGANAGAAEGTQAWALAQVDAAITELLDAAAPHAAAYEQGVPTRAEIERLAAAVARFRRS